MTLDIALGAMRFVSNIGKEGFLDGIGVSKGDFDRLTGDTQWLSSDRNRMTAVLHSVINASVDAMGLPRFTLPAEYIAAGICIFVAPNNSFAACSWAPPTPTAEVLGVLGGCAPTTSQQLFSLVVSLYSDSSRGDCRARFSKNTGLALERSAQKVK